MAYWVFQSFILYISSKLYFGENLNCFQITSEQMQHIQNIYFLFIYLKIG